MTQNQNPGNTGVIPVTTKYSKFVGYAASRIGGRPENQDTIAYTDTPMGLLVLVCDGMGGGPGGKTASVIAAKTIGDYMAGINTPKEPEVALTEAINAGNQAILAYASTHNGFRGMGSTVAAVLLNDECAYAAHIGDSRIYQLRGKKVVYRSTDHSKVMALVKAKIITEEQARTSGESNIITQALGHGSEMVPEIARLPYMKGDRFALCSDGIWGVFPQKQIIDLFTSSPNPAGVVDATVITVDNTGIENGGGHDNLTLAIVDTTSNSKLKVPMYTSTKIIIAALAALCIISIACNAYFILKPADSPDKAAAADTTVTTAANTIDSLQKVIEELRATQATGADIIKTVPVTKPEEKSTGDEPKEPTASTSKDTTPSVADLAKRLDDVEKKVKQIWDNKTEEERVSVRNAAVTELKEILKISKNKTANKKITQAIEWLNNSLTVTKKKDTESHIKKIAEYIHDAQVEMK